MSRWLPEFLGALRQKAKPIWLKHRNEIISVAAILLLLLLNELAGRFLLTKYFRHLRVMIPLLGTTLILGRKYERYSGLISLVAVLIIGLYFSPRHLKTGWPVFMTSKTQFAVLFENAEYGILAAGMTLVIITGGIDLSVGSVLGMVATTFALLVIGFGMPAYLAILVCLGMGAAAGGVNGVLVSKFRIQPFAATLAMMAAARGMAKKVSGQIKVQPGALPWYKVQGDSPDFFVTLTKSLPIFRLTWVIVLIIALGLTGLLVYRSLRKSLKDYAAGFVCALLGCLGAFLWYLHWKWIVILLVVPAVIALVIFRNAKSWKGSFGSGFMSCVVLALAVLAIRVRLNFLVELKPVTLIFVAAIVIMWLVVRYTRFGRHLFAIGGNEEAARLSGIRVGWNKFMAYVCCGLLAGLGGICNAARQELGDPEAGGGYELDAIAAVVIGGTSLSGGRGGMMLTFTGALVIGYINKILSINGITEAWRLMAKGGIIVLAVLIQKRRRS